MTEKLTNEERQTSKQLRRFLLRTPGLEGAMIDAAVTTLYPRRSIEDELADDSDHQDAEHRLWEQGEIDRES